MARGDLTDEQWKRLEMVSPPLPVMGRKPQDRRQVFDGIWWRARTGSTVAGCPGTVWAVGDLVLRLPAVADPRG